MVSRFSPCRRGLAHLKKVHSVVRVVSASKPWLPLQGPENVVRRHLVRPTHCRNCLAATVDGEATGGARAVAMVVPGAVYVQ